MLTPTGSAGPPAALTSAHRLPPAPAAGRRGGPTWSPGPCRGGSGRTRTAPPGTRMRPSAGRAQRQTARPRPCAPPVRRSGGTRGRGGAAATGAQRPLPPRARRVRRGTVPPRSWAPTAARLARRQLSALEFAYFYRAPPAPPAGALPSALVRAAACLRFL